MPTTQNQTNEIETLRRELEETRREKANALRDRDDALSEMRKAYQDVKDIEAEYDLNIDSFRGAKQALEEILAMDPVSFSLGDAKEIARKALKNPEASS